MTHIEAMKQVLEKIATVNAMDYEYQRWAREALAATEESLATQEPLSIGEIRKAIIFGTPLYTHPQPKAEQEPNTEGGPKDNDMHHCPKCGKPAIEAANGITKEQA